MRRQDRIVARVIDAVGKPEQRGADDQRGVAQMQAEHDQRETTDGEADQQDFSRADMVGEIADRGLGQAGDDAEHGQRKTELDIADAELFFKERKQHRQHEEMEMADPMGDRNRSQRTLRSVRLGLLRCGQNVDHVSSKPRKDNGPTGAFSSEVGTGSRQENASNQKSRAPFRFIGTEKALGTGKISSSGYLSMNTAAWLPRRRAGTRQLHH